MDWTTEWEKEFGNSSWKWRIQKQKVEKEVAALQDALRVHKGQVEKLETLLEECDKKFDLCDAGIEMSELIDDLIPPGTIQQKTRALKGWMRIRIILRDEKIGFKEKAQKCVKVFESYIEDFESAAFIEGISTTSSNLGKRFLKTHFSVFLTNICWLKECFLFSGGNLKHENNMELDAKKIKQEVDSASDALAGLIFEEDVGNKL